MKFTMELVVRGPDGGEIDYTGWEVWITANPYSRQLEMGIQVLEQVHTFFVGLHLSHALTALARACNQ